MYIAPDSRFVIGADRSTTYTYLGLRAHELNLLWWAVRVAEDHAASPEDAAWLEMAAEVLRHSLDPRDTQQADQRTDDRRQQDEAWRGDEPVLLVEAATGD